MSLCTSTVRRGPRRGVFSGPSLGLALLVAVGALASCGDPEPSRGGNGATAESDRPGPAAGAVSLPTLSEASLPETDVREPLATRFVIPPKVARRVAVGIARDKGGLSRAAQICASWIRIGPDGALLASEHVVGSGPACDGWSGLLEWASLGWRRREPSHAGEAPAPPSPDERVTTEGLVDVQLASVERFFTVAVAAYSFHHPLYEAQPGLPQWVIRAARSGRNAVPWRCEPRWVRARADRRAEELASYGCPEGPVTFEHGMARTRDDVTLHAHADGVSAFRAWQRAVHRQYPGEVGQRLDRLARLWDRYEGAGAP